MASLRPAWATTKTVEGGEGRREGGEERRRKKKRRRRKKKRRRRRRKRKTRYSHSMAYYRWGCDSVIKHYA
jgi:hypothetical protein